MFVPVVQLVLFYYALGAPHGLKLAVVNEDVDNHNQCQNSSWNVYRNDDDDFCQAERVSCLFINAIDENFVAKQFFPSFDKAYEHFVHGGAIALLHIKSNFTESCNNFLAEGPSLQSILTTEHELEVHIDRTEWGLASDLSYQIRRAFETIPQELLTACNMSHKYLNIPFSLETPLFGEFKWDFRIYIAHTLVAA